MCLPLRKTISRQRNLLIVFCRMMQVLVYSLCRPLLKNNSAKTHGTDYSNNMWHIADIASCELKNRTILSQLSQRNEVVTSCRSYKLLLHIAPCELALRTTVPLVSYIRNSLRFWYYASLVPVVKILKKIGVTGKIWEKPGVKLSRDLIEKSVNFSTLATSNIRLLLGFGEEDQ